MKAQRPILAKRYLAGLRAHLGGKNSAGRPRAQALGQAALARGLLTLDLAAIHQQAMTALAALPEAKPAGATSIKAAGAFFAQALEPLARGHRAVRDANRHLLERNKTLERHTAALGRSNRKFEREIARRKAGEVKIEQARLRYRSLFLESQIMQHKLRRLTRQIIAAQEEERRHISRELHDEVVQTLVGINVELSALGHGAVGNARNLKQKIARTQRLVAHSVSAVHRFARELRPAVLDDLGLIPALQSFSHRLATRKKMTIKMTAFRGVETLSIGGRTVLFRVAQEALNNVARHAEATAVRLDIRQVDGAVQMEISDNGKSFPVKQTLLARNNKRLGLVGMKERLEMIGGRLVIESIPGTGTTVHAEIPFNPQLPKP